MAGAFESQNKEMPNIGCINGVRVVTFNKLNTGLYGNIVPALCFPFFFQNSLS